MVLTHRHHFCLFFCRCQYAKGDDITRQRRLNNRTLILLCLNSLFGRRESCCVSVICNFFFIFHITVSYLLNPVFYHLKAWYTSNKMLILRSKTFIDISNVRFAQPIGFILNAVLHFCFHAFSVYKKMHKTKNTLFFRLNSNRQVQLNYSIIFAFRGLKSIRILLLVF